MPIASFSNKSTFNCCCHPYFTVITLADFNSVFQISIALNLAYTLMRDFHEFHIRKLEEYADSAAKVLDSPPEGSDVADFRFWVHHLRWLIDRRRREIEKRIAWMQVIASAVAVFSLALLIISGVFPELSVSLETISLLLSIALVPTPAFLIYSYVCHRAWLRSIQSDQASLGRAWANALGPVFAWYQARHGSK